MDKNRLARLHKHIERKEFEFLKGIRNGYITREILPYSELEKVDGILKEKGVFNYCK